MFLWIQTVSIEQFFLTIFFWPKPDFKRLLAMLGWVIYCLTVSHG